METPDQVRPAWAQVCRQKAIPDFSRICAEWIACAKENKDNDQQPEFWHGTESEEKASWFRVELSQDDYFMCFE